MRGPPPRPIGCCQFGNWSALELWSGIEPEKDAKAGNGDMMAARADVDPAKVALGERGPVWWEDGAPDLNRHFAKNTPYAEWAAGRKE